MENPTFEHESEIQNTLDYSNFVDKPDNSVEYLVARNTPIETLSDLRILSANEIPQEQINVKDEDAFKRFEFGADEVGNIWLFRRIERRGITERFSQKRELASELAKTLDIPAVEYRTLIIDDQKVFATRFLPNAIDGRIQNTPSDVHSTQIQDLSALWLFNYLICNSGDTQVLSSARGRIFLADYGISSHVPHDINVEKERLNDYRNFIGGIEENVDHDVVQNTISKIKSLSDEQLTLLVSIVADEQLQIQLFESLKWRRDNIQHFFN